MSTVTQIDYDLHVIQKIKNGDEASELTPDEERRMLYRLTDEIIRLRKEASDVSSQENTS